MSVTIFLVISLEGKDMIDSTPPPPTMHLWLTCMEGENDLHRNYGV